MSDFWGTVLAIALMLAMAGSYLVAWLPLLIVGWYLKAERKRRRW